MPTTCRLPLRSLQALRRAALCLLAAAALLAAFLPSAASAASTPPPEGIFEDCSLSTQMPTCLQRLQVMHAGGMQVVVFPADYATPAQLDQYATAAQQLGMKVMWQLSNQGWWDGSSVAGYYQGLTQACACSTNSALLTYLVHFLGSLPATYGYYAADDSMIGPGQQSAISGYVNAIKTLDPSHPAILSSAYEGQTKQYEGIGDMNAAEIYPITTSYLMPASSNSDWWGGVAQEASDDQSLANHYGKASAFILQAFTFGDNLDDGQAVGVCTASMSKQQCWNHLHYPSSGDQLELRNQVLKHAHPKIILWWSFQGTYGQSGGDTYSLYPTGATAASQWSGLVRAVNAPAPGSGALAHTARKAHHRRHHRRHHHRHHHRRHHRHHHRRG